MATALLSSNVVNYLIWRYLQEAGFGNAALQLSRVWNRDPEALPFAHNIEPHTLIKLLQDGMRFDQLQTEACNTEPRYRFGPDHGRPYSVRNGSLLTLDKGIPAHELASEANGAVQEPAPKKGLKRKKAKPTNGIEPRPEPETNGDAMEIEQNGTTHVTESLRDESEAMASETESPTVTDIPISTLSIGHDVEIQTELIADLAPQTIFIPRHKDPDRVVLHTSWDPKKDPILLAAGKSLLQVHLVDTDGPHEPVNIHLPVNNFLITALCWRSHSDMAVSVREECFNERGEKMTMDKLIKLSDGGQTSHVMSSTAGLVNTLRWNADRELLLSISTDGDKGSIKVWKNDSDSIPAWSVFTDTTIMDALWISDSAFAVCGINLFKTYEVGNTLTILRMVETNVQWDNMKYDPASGIVAALGTNHFGILHPNNLDSLQTHEYPDLYPTDLDFCPQTVSKSLTNGTSEPSALLAISSISGSVRVWDANEPFKCLKKLRTIDESQAFKIAFSPDGRLLAAAGPDAVTVWDVDTREVPIASWRAKDWPIEKWNSGLDAEFNLGWHPDSSRLSIALGNQIAIIAIPR